MSSKPLDVEPEFMRLTRPDQEQEQEHLRDLALFINHRLVLTKDQRCRARVRAAKARVARQEAAAREKK